MDEYARAARDLCNVVEQFDEQAFVAVSVSDDPDTVSIRAICNHVCASGHKYADYIRKARGMGYVDSYEIDPALISKPSDLRPQLIQVLHYTEDAIEGMYKADDEEIQALAFEVRWGPKYDPEMIVEHAIVHLLRHRRQLERWKNK